MKVLRELKFTDIANTSGSKSNWANLAMGLSFGVIYAKGSTRNIRDDGLSGMDGPLGSRVRVSLHTH